MSTILVLDGSGLLTVSFGPAKAGLSTVGYTLFDGAGNEYQARSTSDVIDLGNGFYSAVASLGASSFEGNVIWDTGEMVPVYAIEDIHAATDLTQQVNDIDSLAQNLDMAVSGVAAQAATDVWAAGTRALTDKDGFTLSSAGIQAVWDKATSALTTAGSIGKLLGDKIDATVSSRSTYAGADTSGTTTLLSRLTSGRATNLDNLDAAISTRATAATAATAVWAAAARTLTAVSDSSGVTTLLSRLTSGRASNLDFLDASVTNVPAAVWDVTAASHVATGTTGAELSTSGGASQASVDAIKTELDAVKAQTDRIPRIRTQK